MDEENRESAVSEIREADLGQPVQCSRRLLVYRHARITRLTHWINLLCVTALLMSGLQIFMAHPALYWGQFGADADRPAFEIGTNESGDGPQVGFARIGSATFETTGILGVSRNASGDTVQRAFPYRGWTQALQYSHPFLASTLLMSMVKTYEHEASREDTEAEIRRRLR
jgi:hypothetical protein